MSTNPNNTNISGIMIAIGATLILCAALFWIYDKHIPDEINVPALMNTQAQSADPVLPEELPTDIESKDEHVTADTVPNDNATTHAQNAQPISVQSAWHQTTDPAELVEAAALSRCLASMQGDTQSGVLVCELKAMSAGTPTAVDAVLARRKSLLPHIPGPGARYTGEDLPPPSNIARQPEASDDKRVYSGMSDTLPGASDLFESWRNSAQDAGAPEIAVRLIDCMKKSPIISHDRSGLQAAGEWCERRITEEAQRQANASRRIFEKSAQ